MSDRMVRRAARPLLAGGMLAAGLTLFAAPAHAAGRTPVPAARFQAAVRPAAAFTNCSAVEGGLEYASGYVVAEKYRICDDGTERPNPVSIQRQNPATLAWTTVAGGNGTASYKCQGTATRRYRMGTSGAGVAFPCT